MSNLKPSFSMSEWEEYFDNRWFPQVDETFGVQLKEWIRELLASQREEVVGEIRMIVAGNQVVDINSSPLAVLDKSIKELSPNRRKLTNKNKNDMKII